VISGVEIDSSFNGKLWHTLVYGVDPHAPALTALCSDVFTRNAADAARLIHELPAAGFVLDGLAQLGRTPNVADVATALARANDLPGRISGEHDEAAGMRFLLTAWPGAYNPIAVTTIIDLAHSLGGIAILAHPGRSNGIYAIPATSADIAALAEAGLDGIECYYPTHTAEQRAAFLHAAQQHGLLVSGGSDSHHPHQPLANIAPDLLAPLLERLND
jgi:predicted metal-dependent phosphoesterase TrpH